MERTKKEEVLSEYIACQECVIALFIFVVQCNPSQGTNKDK